MKFFLAVTDDDWFHYLAHQEPDEVNFWRPSSTMNFKAIPEGAPFLFKLHSPNDYVVGGGFFCPPFNSAIVTSLGCFWS